jgi:hypothetical protein
MKTVSPTLTPASCSALVMPRAQDTLETPPIVDVPAGHGGGAFNALALTRQSHRAGDH